MDQATKQATSRQSFHATNSNIGERIQNPQMMTATNSFNVTKSSFMNTKYTSNTRMENMNTTPMGSTFVESRAPGTSSLSKTFARRQPVAALASNYNTLNPLAANGPAILLTDSSRKETVDQARREYNKNKSLPKTHLCPKNEHTDRRIKEPSYSRLMNETFSKNK